MIPCTIQLVNSTVQGRVVFLPVHHILMIPCTIQLVKYRVMYSLPPRTPYPHDTLYNTISKQYSTGSCSLPPRTLYPYDTLYNSISKQYSTGSCTVFLPVHHILMIPCTIQLVNSTLHARVHSSSPNTISSWYLVQYNYNSNTKLIGGGVQKSFSRKLPFFW